MLRMLWILLGIIPDDKHSLVSTVYKPLWGKTGTVALPYERLFFPLFSKFYHQTVSVEVVLEGCLKAHVETPHLLNRCKADRRLGEEMQNEFLEKPLWCEMLWEKVAPFAQGIPGYSGREGLDIRQNLQGYAALTNDPRLSVTPNNNNTSLFLIHVSYVSWVGHGLTSDVWGSLASGAASIWSTPGHRSRGRKVQVNHTLALGSFCSKGTHAPHFNSSHISVAKTSHGEIPEFSRVRLRCIILP